LKLTIHKDKHKLSPELETFHDLRVTWYEMDEATAKTCLAHMAPWKFTERLRKLLLREYEIKMSMKRRTTVQFKIMVAPYKANLQSHI